MIDALMLVLREALEAALILSLLMALGIHLKLARWWAAFGLFFGILLSLTLSQNAMTIAESIDGTGQEIANVLLYFLSIISMLLINTVLAPCLAPSMNASSISKRWLSTMSFCFFVVFTCSMAREVCEIWIYLAGFWGTPASLRPALTGSAIGFCLGFSVGALCYFAFLSMPRMWFLRFCFCMLALAASGMSLQVARLLMQIDQLPSGTALWDSSALINEASWIGQFSHALFGYDANPNSTQVISYLSCLAILAFSCTLRWQACQRQQAAHAGAAL